MDADSEDEGDRLIRKGGERNEHAQHHSMRVVEAATRFFIMGDIPGLWLKVRRLVLLHSRAEPLAKPCQIQQDPRSHVCTLLP